jgi:hypothetical protein
MEKGALVLIHPPSCVFNRCRFFPLTHPIVLVQIVLSLLPPHPRLAGLPRATMTLRLWQWMSMLTPLHQRNCPPGKLSTACPFQEIQESRHGNTLFCGRLLHSPVYRSTLVATPLGQDHLRQNTSRLLASVQEPRLFYNLL